jgi:hypothetical protein
MGKVTGMDRRLKKLIVGAAVILLLGGASAAALTATGQSKRPGAHAARLGRPGHAFVRRGGRDLSTAAGYLGISTAQLAAKLSAGQSLAEIASATPGRSAAGLIEALVTAKRAALAAIAAKLPKRVRAEVERPGGPRGAAALERARGAAHRARHQARVPPAHRLIATPGFRAAAGYLGMSAAQLQSELESGRTLAAIASATSGKSESGLIDAIVAAKQEVLAAARAASSITAAREKAMTANMRKRVEKLVKRTFASTARAR